MNRMGESAGHNSMVESADSNGLCASLAPT
jgi:hypothetical protein